MAEGPTNNFVPTDKNLADISNSIGTGWEYLALCLNVPLKAVWHIKEDHKQSRQQQIYNMLLKWRNIERSNATMNSLFGAMWNATLVSIDWNTLLEMFGPMVNNGEALAPSTSDIEDSTRKLSLSGEELTPSTSDIEDSTGKLSLSGVTLVFGLEQNITCIEINFNEPSVGTVPHIFYDGVFQGLLNKRWCGNLKEIFLKEMHVGEHCLSVNLTESDIHMTSENLKSNLSVSNCGTALFGHYLSGMTFHKNDFVLEMSNVLSFADTIILDIICHALLTCNKDFVEVYPVQIEGKGEVLIVCFVLAKATSKQLEQCEGVYKTMHPSKEHNEANVFLGKENSRDFKTYPETFRGFKVEYKEYYCTSGEALRVENSEECWNNRDALQTHCVALMETISKYTAQLIHTHSNIEVVCASSVRSIKGLPVKSTPHPCIVFYCRCKSFIPYKEPMFPKQLTLNEEIIFETDVREGYFIPCMNPAILTTYGKEYNMNIAMGCSIGPKDQGSAATIGSFVNFKDNPDETCFLTVKRVLGTLPANGQDRFVPGIKFVQPADRDVNRNSGLQSYDRLCGEVIYHELSDVMDVALIKIDEKRRPTRGSFAGITDGDLQNAGFTYENFPTYEDGAVIDVNQLTTAEYRCQRIIKIGNTTGLRQGSLQPCGGLIRTTDYHFKIDFNGRPYVYHNITNQMLVQSFAGVGNMFFSGW